MIHPAVIRNMKGALEEIADENYQRDAWLGKPATSDLGNVYECLQYDCDFSRPGGYIETADLTEYQKQSAQNFANRLNKYYDPRLTDMSAKTVMNDPRWHQIRSEAQKLLPILFPEDAARYAMGQWQSGK
jgi:hypothetical protein